LLGEVLVELDLVVEVVLEDISLVHILHPQETKQLL
jgi:hypothetical protein